ncbi:MAG: helix-turn-helix domain-containing protein [Elusimicrobia bacterium]|nr:helix-turn-helix domain-containing protein [Elusimicrobiota bacterium]
MKREDKKVLADLTRRGRQSLRVIRRAQVLQLVAKGRTAEDAAEAAGVATRTVKYIKERYAEGGLERAIWDAPRGGPKPALNGKQEARIVAMVCGPWPQGEARWSVRLVASEAVARGIAPKVGRETIRLLMRDHELKPWREKNVVHPGTDAGIRESDGEPARSLREALGSSGAGGRSGREAGAVVEGMPGAHPGG